MSATSKFNHLSFESEAYYWATGFETGFEVAFEFSAF